MVLDVISQRASIREFSEKKIPESDIIEILEAGRLAPSWMNVQPWHFISVSEKENKDLIATLANNQKQINEASHIILVIADMEAWNKDRFSKILKMREGMTDDRIEFIFNTPGLYPKLGGKEMLLLRTMEQCTYAMAYMTLQAKALNIDSSIIGAFGNELTEFNPELSEEVKTKLEIPQGNYIVGILALGYKKETTKVPNKLRKDFNEVVSKERYNNKY